MLFDSAGSRIISGAGILAKRVVRRLIWPHPAVYLPFGILRGRGNILRSDFQLYISGFPRSGNSFAVKAFLAANPSVRMRSHKHIPSFILQSVKWNMPGMLLVRNPVDAAISWSIYMKKPMRETLAYYVDFHSILLPHRERLFIVPFEDVIEDFGKVTERFNARWGTSYAAFEHTPENVAKCVTQIESEYVDTGGRVIEHQVPRPSAHRRAQKAALLDHLAQSAEVRKELRRANELYQCFAPKKFTPQKPRHKTTTTQSIRLRPAM